MRRTSIFIYLVLLALIGPATAAEPLGLKSVPADAIFFLHADVSKIVAHPWGQAALQVMKAADPRMMKEIEQYGFDASDIEEVTLFITRAGEGNGNVDLAAIVKNRRAFRKDKVMLPDRESPAKAANDVPLSGDYGLFFPDEKTAVIATNDLLPMLKGRETRKPQKRAMAPYLEMAAGKPFTVAGQPGKLPEYIRKGLARETDILDILAADTICFQLDLQKVPALEMVSLCDTEATAGVVKSGFETRRIKILKRWEKLQEEINEEAKKEPVPPFFSAALRSCVASFEKLEFQRDKRIVRGRLAAMSDFPLDATVRGFGEMAAKLQEEQRKTGNFKLIGLAILNYESAFGHFPANAMCDKAGKPLLSWRVALLPYLEQQSLYDEFHLDEPWDGEHNKKLIAKMPAIYLMDKQKNEGKTHFRLFQGNGALFENTKQTPIAAVTDGLSNTAMLFPIAEAVEWTKPDELPYDPQKDPKKRILFQEGKTLLLMADGSVRPLSDKVSSKTYHAIITKAGGEIIEYQDMKR